MKRIVAVIVLLLCLTAVFLASDVSAAGGVYFTAIDYTLLTLRAETMPATFGGTLYIPYTFFSSDALGVYFASGSDQVLIYSSSGSKSLSFDTTRGTVFDQDRIQRYFAAVKANGLIYLPVASVCEFFGINHEIITSFSQAPVVRFTKGSFSINEETFIGLNRSRLLAEYNAYVGLPSGTASPSPGTTPLPSPSPSAPPTYENVSVYLSFTDLTPQNFAAVLDTLAIFRYKGCFFVSAGEIAGNAELLRRAAGVGQSVGIRLMEGTLAEYRRASALLFEAAKLRTILVSAGGDAIRPAESMAASNGLVFWTALKTYDDKAKVTVTGVTERLSVIGGSRESLNFACTDSTTPQLGSIFAFLYDKKYSVRRLTEKTVPTISIG